jgi:hypothetical protein
MAIASKRPILLMGLRMYSPAHEKGIAQSETLMDNGAPPHFEVP